MTYDNETGPMGTTSVSAMFDNQAEAQRAVDRLVDAGIPMGRIRMISGGSDTGATQVRTEDHDKGFWDSLSDFFFPDEDRYAYAEGLSRGGYLVTVSGLSGAEYDHALDILDDEGSVNLDERTDSWRAEGWGGYEASPYASGSTASAYESGTASGTAAGMGTRGGVTGEYADHDNLRGEETIPIVEERLRVGKRETSHGRVRVRAYTVEEPVNESVDLREQHVEIERRPVDRAVTGADAAFQDRTLEAEEYREEAVVDKEARVVEEIGLRKTSETRRETISDTVRHTEVEVEQDDDDLTRNATTRDDPNRGTL